MPQLEVMGPGNVRALVVTSGLVCLCRCKQRYAAADLRVAVWPKGAEGGQQLCCLEQGLSMLVI